MKKSKTKNLSRIISVILAMIFLISVPFSASAAKSYKNNSTVKIACASSKTYDYCVGNSCGFSMSGNVEIKKGGVLSADKVKIVQRPCSESPGNVRTITVNLTMSDGTKKSGSIKMEIKDGKTVITKMKDGKVVSTETKGITAYYGTTTFEVEGKLWKALKTVKVVVKQNGVSYGDLGITFTT